MLNYSKAKKCGVVAIVGLLNTPMNVLAFDDFLQPGLQAKLGLASYIGNINSVGVLGEDDSVIIESLGSELPSYSFVTLLPEIDLAYNFSRSHGLSLKVFSDGVQRGTALDVQPYLNFEYTQLFDSGMKVWVSHAPGFLNVSLVWQDPYLTGEALESTNAQVDLLSVGVDFIFGSPLSFSVSRGEQKVDKEQSAQQSNLGLSQQQIDLLNRNADSLEFDASVTLPILDDLFIVLGAKLARVNAEGQAQSYHQGGLNLGGIYIKGAWQAFAQLGAGTSDYDKANPIFNQNRDDDIFNMSAGLSVKELFGIDNTEWSAYVHMSERKSNIQFFNQSEEIVGLSSSYRF